MDDSFEEDDVEKEVAFLAKNFRKFLKMKNSGKSFSKGRFSSPKSDKNEFKKRDGKDSQSPQGIVCYECNGDGQLKKECPNYLRGKGKVFATTLSDSESSNSDMEGKCDSEGNYKAFMAIASVDSKDDLSNWLMNLVIFLRMRKLKNRKMKTCAKLKGRTTFKKHMTLCWKIVANKPKLRTLL